MTRFELQKELKRIDGFIEVLHELISKPLCGCITHLGGFNEKFREENNIQLKHLTDVKNMLLLLTSKTDGALQEIHHHPVNCY